MLLIAGAVQPAVFVAGIFAAAQEIYVLNMPLQQLFTFQLLSWTEVYINAC